MPGMQLQWLSLLSHSCVYCVKVNEGIYEKLHKYKYFTILYILKLKTKNK